MKTIFETRLAKVAETSAHYRQCKISSSVKAKEFCLTMLGEYFGERLDCEEFLIVTLDTKNVVTNVIRITRGVLDASLVHPREVFRPAIHVSAASILLVHNHPSGNAEPSREDRLVTNRLEEAGRTLGIDVLDHIVCGAGVATSIKES